MNKIKDINKFSLNKKISFLKLKFLLIILFYGAFNIDTTKIAKEDLTIVTAYYKIKSKHKPEEYLKWMNNLLMINKAMVIFTSRAFMKIIKEIRPKNINLKLCLLN